MLVRQPQAEAFGSLGEQAHVAAAVQEIVDKLTARSLLLAHGLALGAFVALGKSVQGMFYRCEDAVG